MPIPIRPHVSLAMLDIRCQQRNAVIFPVIELEVLHRLTSVHLFLGMSAALCLTAMEEANDDMDALLRERLSMQINDLMSRVAWDAQAALVAEVHSAQRDIMEKSLESAFHDLQLRLAAADLRGRQHRLALHRILDVLEDSPMSPAVGALRIRSLCAGEVLHGNIIMTD